MGWTGLARSREESDKDFFAREFSCCNVIDMAKHGNTYYLVLEHKNPEGKQRNGKWACVVLTSWNNKDRFNFRYKDIDESMGPCESNCPIRLLDQLSPTDSEYANEWRKRCREGIKRKSAGRKKLKPGTIIKLKEPLKFTDKSEHQVFTVVEYARRKGKGTAYRALDNGRLYRITNVATREYEVLESLPAQG